MQTVREDGLQPATQDEKRFTIVPIYNTNESLVQGLQAMWANNTPLEAFSTLSKPDVIVTNASDKTDQLPKILKFDERVRRARQAMDGKAKEVGKAGGISTVELTPVEGVP